MVCPACTGSSVVYVCKSLVGKPFAVASHTGRTPSDWSVANQFATLSVARTEMKVPRDSFRRLNCICLSCSLWFAVAVLDCAPTATFGFCCEKLFS